MDSFRIIGGQPLFGQLTVSGSKNAALPIIAASLLFKEKVTLTNIPELADIRTMIKLLNILGAETTFENNRLTIDPTDLRSDQAPYELVKTMRASIYVMGPLLATKGHTRVSFPGGCSLGVRPIDIHLKGFEKLGASIEVNGGDIVGKAKHLKGSEINLAFPSVGATCNLIMAAVLAKGITKMKNFAKEPEIWDLVEFLNRSGAKIMRKEEYIEIEGVEALSPIEYSVMPDRIELGTLGAAALITGGEIKLKWQHSDIISSFREKLEDMGHHVRLDEEEGIYTFKAGKMKGNIDVRTLPYPGFPTDLQPLLGVLLTLNKGTSHIHETIFENRFMWVPELERMGADIHKEGESIIINGVKTLQAAPIMASDIRAGASLVLAALAAKGETVIRRIYHIDRGYENLEKKLSSVGAKIFREKI